MVNGDNKIAEVNQNSYKLEKEYLDVFSKPKYPIW